MKNHLLRSASVLLLAGLLSYGAVGTLVSTYLIALSPALPAAVCGGVSLVCLLLLPRRHGKTVLLCLSALLLGFVCALPETLAQTKGLLMYLTRLLDDVYHLGYLDFPGFSSGRSELPIALYGGILTLCVCRTLLLRKSCFLPLLLCLPCLLLCALLPGAFPAPVSLLCWIAGVMLLLITSGSWKISPAQGAQLTLRAVIPVLLLCVALFALNPQARYRDHAAFLRQRVLSRMERELGDPALPKSVIPAPRRDTDLSSLTGWNQPQMPVLIVTAPFSGQLYLRGQDFSRYTGLRWAANPDTVEAFSGWGDESGEVSIRTLALQGVLYLPYFPGTGTVLTGGDLENRAGLLSYSFPRYTRGSAAPESVLSECLALPESTALWASQYSFPGGTAEEIAAQIGRFVRESATYDKQTGQMPASETDFAKWFLEESDTGFCVHFATAAVVLLRAQGIPARYVTGYSCSVQAGSPQIVTTLEAHAWAEYYDADLGSWQILEATPSEILSRPTLSQPVPTESASPSEPTLPAPAPQEGEHRGSALLWLLLPGVVLALYLRRLAVLFLRRRRREEAGVNRRCLLWWAEAQRLSKPLGKTPPQPLLELAERARYSQHRLTPMDLRPLESYCAQCRREMEALPLFKRLANKYIRVLY